MGQSHQVAVVSGRIDHDEVEGPLDRTDGIHELLKFGVFVLRDLHGLTELDGAMHRQFEIDAGAARPGTAVVDVMGKAQLPAIEIDGGDALAGLHQGNCDMQRSGRFA